MVGECFVGGPGGYNSKRVVVVGDSHMVSEDSEAVCGECFVCGSGGHNFNRFAVFGDSHGGHKIAMLCLGSV